MNIDNFTNNCWDREQERERERGGEGTGDSEHTKLSLTKAGEWTEHKERARRRNQAVVIY